MHMADALVSPEVGGAMWAVTAGLVGFAAQKVQSDPDGQKIPLMGVLGAFVFSAQMINFAIPGTGSSGHLSGGLILAVLLGPFAGFITIASILAVQALFFADGGLLALGCNIFNIGFFSCFIAYPLIYKPLMKKGLSPKRIFIASMLAAVIALQFGSFSVVLETVMSGRTDLPFRTFVLLMQPIHLAIGTVEGLITMAVIGFVRKARPEILEPASSGRLDASFSFKGIIVVFALAAVLTVGVFSWFASTNPDGLEWSILRTTGKEIATAEDSIHRIFAGIQRQTVIFPDYSFKGKQTKTSPSAASRSAMEKGKGQVLPGLIGGGIILLLIGVIGFGVRFFKKELEKTE